MTNLTNPTYIKLRDLILTSEGKTPEDELAKEQCILNVDKRFYKIIGKVVNRTPIDKESEYRYQLVEYGGWGAENLCSAYSGDDIKKYKILGLPISLERLLAIIGKEVRQDFSAGIHEQGHITLVWVMDEEVPCGEEQRAFSFSWQLCKPLHEQSQEVWEKLIEILESNQK